MHGPRIPSGLWKKVQIIFHTAINISTIIDSTAAFLTCMIGQQCINSCIRNKSSESIDFGEGTIALVLQRDLEAQKFPGPKGLVG